MAGTRKSRARGSPDKLHELKQLVQRLASAGSDPEIGAQIDAVLPQDGQPYFLQSAQKALRDSEELFRQFMDHLPGLIFIKDRQDHYLYANRAWLMALGIEPGQALGKTSTELWGETVAQQLNAHDSAVIRHRKSIQDIEYVPGVTGERCWMVSKFPIFGARNKVEMIGGFAMDITERRKAELELEQKSRALAERVKEQRCLQYISDLLVDDGSGFDALMQQVAEALPAGFQFPDALAARITIGKAKFTTPGFRSGRRRITARIGPQGIDSGRIEVCYHKGKPPAGTDDFLQEEQNLLDLVAQKITLVGEHRRTQQALRDSEQRFELFMHESPMVASIKDVQGHYLFVNAEWERVSGRSATEAYGRTPGDIWSPETAALLKEHYRRVLERGSSVQTREFVTDAKGVTRYWLSNSFPIAGNDGNAALIGTVAVDITELTRTEERLSESETRYRHLFESNPHPMWVYDIETLRFLEVNDAAVSHYSFSRDEFMNMTLRDIRPAEDIPALLEDVASQYESSSRPRVWRHLCKDGRVILVEISSCPLSYDGHAARLTLAHDVTERVRAEKQLQDRERQLSLITDTLPGLVSRVDRDLRYLFVNAAYERWFGKPRDFFLGRSIAEVIGVEAFRIAEPYMRRTLQGEHTSYEISTTVNNGKQLHAAVTHVPDIGDDGTVNGLFTTAFDISDRIRDEALLRESEARFRNVARVTSDGIWDWELKSGKVWWNEGMQRLFGFRPDEATYTPEAWRDRIHGDDRERVWNDLRRTMSGADDTWSGEYRFRRRDGRYAYLLDRALLIRDADGQAVRMVGGVTDLTESREAELRIMRLNRVYKVLSAINSLIVHTDEQQALLREACRIAVEDGEFCMAWVGLLSPDEKTILPQAQAGHVDHYLDYLDLSLDVPEGTQPVSAAGKAMHSGRALTFNYDPETQSGDAGGWQLPALERGYRAVAALPLIVAGTPVGVMSIYSTEPDFFDADEMKLLTELAGDIAYALQNLEKEAQLAYLSAHDMLTGLLNRDNFLQSLPNYLSGTVLLLCDVRQLVNINNVFSRLVGDRILQEVARRLQELPAPTGLVARVTSSTFAICLPDISNEDDAGVVIRQTLLPALTAPYHIDKHIIVVDFAMGAALAPDRTTLADTLFSNAEAALEQSLLNRTDLLFHRPAMSERINARMVMERNLRLALQKQQFVLHYQPKLEVRSGRIAGVEALLRWQDPDNGLVPPFRFIPLLEETGLILDVGHWVMQQAAADQQRWQSMFDHVPRIAVNLSPVQLRQVNLVELIEQATLLDGVRVKLEFEITESLIMTDIDENIEKLEALRKLGMGIAIDDFGTGYSSLSYITRLPLDTIKIDRAFIESMTEGPQNMAVVSTVITLAHGLGLRVVAEGVETEEQAKFLRLLKCDEMQGFLFSKPVPAAEIEKLLQAQQSPG